MKMANAIPVHKGAGRTSRLVAAAKDRVARGISIVAFPEAHRTIDGKLRPFRRGVFFMARAVGIPVVPVAIRGLRRILPKGTLVVTPGALDVYIGPPLETTDLSDDQVGVLAETARQIIVDYLEHGRTVDGLQIEPRPIAPSTAARTPQASV